MVQRRPQPPENVAYAMRLGLFGLFAPHAAPKVCETIWHFVSDPTEEIVTWVGRGVGEGGLGKVNPAPKQQDIHARYRWFSRQCRSASIAARCGATHFSSIRPSATLAHRIGIMGVRGCGFPEKVFWGSAVIIRSLGLTWLLNFHQAAHPDTKRRGLIDVSISCRFVWPLWGDCGTSPPSSLMVPRGRNRSSSRVLGKTWVDFRLQCL